METYLINCCAPTLAGKKVANMFTIRDDSETVRKKVSLWNKKLEFLGIKISILKQTPTSSLIYVYSEDKLVDTLKDIEIMSFLHSLGYTDSDYNMILKKIKNNLRNSKDFPHEIGLLLGYPVKDVKGFIKHNGKEFSALGHWKVYGDSEQAEEAFCEYKKCRNCFMELYCKGYNCLEIIEKYNSNQTIDNLLK